MDQKRKKQLLWQLPFLTVLIVGTVLIVRQQHTMPYQKASGLIFGTTYHITYQWADDLKAPIEARLQQVDAALSMFNEQSVITHINQGDETIPDTPEGRMFLDVCRRAMQISADTDGAFDITVAPLVNLWGFGFKQGTPPTPHSIDSIRRIVGYQKLTIGQAPHGLAAIHKSDPRMMLDCSAIAKGYGVDVVAQLLWDRGVRNFIVEIGGEVVTRGVNPQRVPWAIGVTKPVDDSLATAHTFQTILNVTDKAMATSGNYRNYYYKDGRKYAHTVDPHTGRPVQHSLLSATVLADDCATADAYATAFMVMGLDSARTLLRRHPELMAYLIYSSTDGTNATWYSPTLRSKIQDN